MSRPMNDDEVLSEMKKMVAFIKQEAMEKAREIQVKADEEFSIEKAKIVRQEAINIDAQHEKKTKQAEVSQRIAQSTATNKSRLRILQAREAHLQTLFDRARASLASLTSDPSAYSTLLRDLILQGLLRIMEPSVTVSARVQDVQLVQDAAKDAQSLYAEKTGGKEVEVDVKEGLGKDSAGGVLLAGLGGRIKVDNTLDERLRLLEEQMLPEIRMDLFGPNENRKFYT
ncbi:putative vacuolar ATP synthase subunit E [Tilletiaria anomala UBC 951]|uniref:Putative vacuolar ATP synthase subunit E n=1 Tax=Tilletiaria anomala (strain ATCC 24038 / CBS 436.72 / UBC 951) TaxID=1037660 RepID=A0A066VDI9_TILAU|nr:putative vacuolar ATP synthase subunit E [Tilletiaria anomala UBC 951]KDN39541.1 putative vacuolar ATP synthase subunit E [Tilletiaria anomala UBC 951]